MTQRRLGESYSFIHAIDTAQDTRYKIHEPQDTHTFTCAKHRVIEDTFPCTQIGWELGALFAVLGMNHMNHSRTGLRSIFDRLSSYIQRCFLPILQAICHLLMLIAVEINIDWQVEEERERKREGVPTHLWLILWGGCCSCLHCWPYFFAFEAKVSGRYKSIFGTRIW